MAATTTVKRPETGIIWVPWWGYSAFFMGAQTLFGLYVFWVVIFDWPNRVSFDPYLSPFFSPLLPAASIAGLLISPGIFIVWSPLLFRVSCYYYRKAYHRALFAPPACAMEPPSMLQRFKYRGERTLPWVFNNLHRFFLYTAIVNIAFLTYDVVRSFHTSSGQFMLGVGTVLLAVNVLMLCFYTFGCHAFRHLVGGSLDCYSCTWTQKARRSIWERVSALNHNHGTWALVSLFTVWGSDVYIRLLIHGVLRDPRIIF